MTKERYFKCPSCGEVTTQSKIDYEVEFCGSVGMCYCEYMESFINDQGHKDVWYPRVFVKYEEITKEEYDRLRKQKPKKQDVPSNLK